MVSVRQCSLVTVCSTYFHPWLKLVTQKPYHVGPEEELKGICRTVN